MKSFRGWFWVLAGALCFFITPTIFLSLLFTYGTEKPKRWLILLSLVGELLTALPLGITTLVIFTPLIIRRFLKNAPPAATFTFLTILVGTVCVQYVLLAGFEVGSHVILSGAGQIWRFIPWWPTLAGAFLSSLATFALFALRGLFLPTQMSR